MLGPRPLYGTSASADLGTGGGPGAHPLQMPRATAAKFWGSQKLYLEKRKKKKEVIFGFLTAQGLASLTPALFRAQLCIKNLVNRKRRL